MELWEEELCLSEKVLERLDENFEIPPDLSEDEYFELLQDDCIKMVDRDFPTCKDRVSLVEGSIFYFRYMILPEINIIRSTQRGRMNRKQRKNKRQRKNNE